MLSGRTHSHFPTSSDCRNTGKSGRVYKILIVFGIEVTLSTKLDAFEGQEVSQLASSTTTASSSKELKQLRLCVNPGKELKLRKPTAEVGIL